MGWFFRKNPCYGLDIQEQKITMIKLQKSGNSYEIANFGQIPLFQGAMEGNVIVNEAEISYSLGQISEKLGAKSAKIAVAVSGDNVIARNLVVPVMPENELAEAVRFEMEAQIPIPGKEVTIDFIKYDVITEKMVQKQEVLAVAVKNEVIDRLTRIITNAGLEPVVMDIEPLVLVRTIRTLDQSSIPHEGSYAIVNIGSSSTNISVFEGEQMFFTRTLGFGVYKLSMSLSAHFNISLEEAELAVKQAAISLEDSSTALPGSSDEMLMPKINGLLTEVRRSMEYYMSQRPGRRIMRMFVTGEGAFLLMLSDYLNNLMEFPVTIFNPAKFVQISAKLKDELSLINDNGPALSKVMGLALSEAL